MGQHYQAFTPILMCIRLKELKIKIDDDIWFCGDVDAQELLINGTPEMVRTKVSELKVFFSTGLIISPSHEAILKDINPVNVEAIFSNGT